MSTYTLHLGFNWEAPFVGAIWTTTSSDHRFLQYALALQGQAGDTPAWFQLAVDDVVEVLLWDLTSSASAPATSALAPTIAMSFLPLDNYTLVPTSYLPTDLISSDAATAKTMLVGDHSQNYLQFKGTTADGAKRCPWGSYRSCVSAGSMTISGGSSYKLSFFVSVLHAGHNEVRSFVSDPEVIIGSQGTPPSRPGPK